MQESRSTLCNASAENPTKSASKAEACCRLPSIRGEKKHRGLRVLPKAVNLPAKLGIEPESHDSWRNALMTR